MVGIFITSWQIEGETVTDFILFGSQITVDGDCNHEMKRCPTLLITEMQIKTMVKYYITLDRMGRRNTLDRGEGDDRG